MLCRNKVTFEWLSSSSDPAHNTSVTLVYNCWRWWTYNFTCCWHEAGRVLLWICLTSFQNENTCVVSGVNIPSSLVWRQVTDSQRLLNQQSFNCCSNCLIQLTLSFDPSVQSVACVCGFMGFSTTLFPAVFLTIAIVYYCLNWRSHEIKKDINRQTAPISHSINLINSLNAALFIQSSTTTQQHDAWSQSHGTAICF